MNGQEREVSHTIFQGSRTHIALNAEETEDQLPEVFQTIHTKFQEFQREGSGWTLEKVNHIEVHSATYNPLQGSSYIKLPKKLETTKACINVQNTDNKCFLWSVLAHLHPVPTDPNRKSERYTPYEHELDVDRYFVPNTCE